MKIINREKYLNQLISIVGTPDIKVITGIRRCGKSELLLAFKRYLENDDNNNVIHINMNFEQNEHLTDRKVFSSYVRSLIKEGKKNILMVDEVQNIINFEKTFNSLHDERIFDIYLTGSNAFLLSSDLATLFTGRVYEIEVYPFSFKEYCEYFEEKDYQSAFSDYFEIGGFAGSYNYKSAIEKNNYLRKEVIETIIQKDITKKYNIRSKSIFKSLVDYLIDNISNLTNSKKISDFLTRNNNQITNKTIENYINYLTLAFVFYKCQRYDVKGKKYLCTNNKYYLVDTSLKSALLGSKSLDYGKRLENIVYIELLRRGYEVYVGKIYEKEVDFVVLKPNDRTYIQVCYDLENLETRKREVNSLLSIKDSYEKIIIARTKQPMAHIDGIKVYDIADWLMNEY